MNHFILQHNALETHEEGNFDQKGIVICPKPRRVGVFPNMTTRSLRWKFCQQGEGYDSKAREELLDIIQNNEASASPPYFLGSPPIRAPNPLIHDEEFGYEKHMPESTFATSSSPSLSFPSSASSPSSPRRKGGCVRMKFGIKSATVRVVGFDCHIPAVA